MIDEPSNASGAMAHPGFPLGPTVAAVLGLSHSQDGAGPPPENAAMAREVFEDAVLERLPDCLRLDSVNTTIDAIEELVAMGMPRLALTIQQEFFSEALRHDFRACLSLGSAAADLGLVDEADSFWREALALAPLEPAPYVNLAQVSRLEGRDDEAREIVREGLLRAPNYSRLWALAEQLPPSGQSAPEYLKQLAAEVHSWMGSARAALLAEGEAAEHAALERAYQRGERDADFLTHYTARLGMSGDYEGILTVLWKTYPHTASEIPWQLEMHRAQAQMALGQGEAAQVTLAKLAQRSDSQGQALEHVRSLQEDLAASQA